MKENISALMDGQLGEHECTSCFKVLKNDPELREAWDVYHLIGDAMRGHGIGTLNRDFVERLNAEPTVLAPQRRIGKPSTRWALSAAASLAAVGFVGWMTYPFFVAQDEQIATAQPAADQAEVRVIPAAQDLDDYQLAHQRYATNFGMSGVAPYVRTVSSEDGRP